MNALRSLLTRRLAVSLALAGLLMPLVPTAEASDVAEMQLAEVLGHADAVQSALDSAWRTADPLDAFVEAYAVATGQDAEDIRARLEGQPLWLSTDFPTPEAVLVAAGPSAVSASRGLTGIVPRSLRTEGDRGTVVFVTPDSQSASIAEARSAHGPRGP